VSPRGHHCWPGGPRQINPSRVSILQRAHAGRPFLEPLWLVDRLCG